MGSKEQELKLELLQERETIKELSDNWDKRKVEIESLEKEKMELKTALVSLEKRLGEGTSEMNHKVEFLQSQVEETELSEHKSEIQKLLAEKGLYEEEGKIRSEKAA